MQTILLGLSWAALLSPVASFLAHNIFQTGDARLFSRFCVSSPEELAEVGLNTSTQQDIIQTAVKRSVATYLTEKHNMAAPPDLETVSLSELYQHFLGSCSSPDRFILAVSELVDSAAKMDTLPGIKYDPRFHFDAESILEGQATLVERLGLVVTSIKTEAKFPAARDLLGKSLHAITTFYAHTNWVELGYVEPSQGLGYPGGELPGLADPSLPACQNTSLITTNLTSGYLPHQVEVEGRCRHGSQEDPVGLGGINKDTSSLCWSPHAQHHQLAADLATQAVEEYLDHLRFIINNDNFGNLFDLSFGSALVIAIDRSGSMCDEIDAVKLKVTEIVETALETGVSPSRYVLVPFGDPPVPPPLVTTDPQEYLDAVLLMDCSWGGNEQFWSAVQLGLTNAPPYSDIIVFTDEPGDDTYKKENVIGLAESLFSQVSVIYSEGASIPGDHVDLCTATGGLCILFSQVDAGDIVELLSSSIEESKAIISQYQNLTDLSLNDIEVDSTLVTGPDSLTEIQITGEMQLMQLQNPSNQKKVDLMDDTSIANSGLQMEVIIRTENLLYIKFKPDEAGRWSLILQSTPSSAPYSITALASCTFSFLSTFRFLDLDTNHPNLHKIPGRPVRNTQPTMMVTMTGNYKDVVADIEGISFIDNKGVVYESHELQESYEGQENFIIQTVYEQTSGLTRNPFYVRLEGTDSNGFTIHRLLPTLVTPVSTQVEVTASSSLLESTPGNQTTAVFMVSDFGDPTSVTIDIVDDKGFLADFSPKIIQLSNNESQPINATFSVPASAEVGSVSTITVTATSSADQTSNSVSVTLTVVTGQTDMEPPTCQLDLHIPGEEPCQGTPPDQCDEEHWTFGALVEDSNSGLVEIRVNTIGEGNLTADFEYGTKEAVHVKYETSCCNNNVSLTAFDLLGNWATGCREEFSMRNCSLIQVREVGPTWIYFEWSRPCDVEEAVDVDYSFIVTNLATMDAGFVHHVETCDTAMCHDNFTYATPCTEYSLDMNATYNDGQTTRRVGYRRRQAVTGEMVTSGPENFELTGQGSTDLTVSWSAPFLNSCLSHYSVCYHSYRLGETCLTTANTSLNIINLLPCSHYHITLRAFTSSGLSSAAVTLDAETLPEHPGPVQNLRLASTGTDFITVEWDVPVVNPTCVKGYDATCYENNQTISRQMVQTERNTRSSNSATMAGLSSCTSYICEVRALGTDHWQSDLERVEGNTTTATLDAPTDFDILSVSERQATLTWSCPPETCRCVHEFLVHWSVPNTTIFGEKLVDRREQEVTLVDLLPCTQYQVTIQGVAEDGLLGDQALLPLQTHDTPPGQVQHLSTTSVGQEEFTARWQPPAQDPQCVGGYQTTLSEHPCQVSGEGKVSGQAGVWEEYTAGNLTCDTCYLFLVSPESPAGLVGVSASLDIWTQEC